MKLERETAVYLTAITRAEPNLTVESVTTNNEGLVNSMLVVNGRCVFRVPKHDWESEQSGAP